jgi:DNA-binding response OmpR family regulator
VADGDRRDPGVSGLDICRALRGTPAVADMLIILLTARYHHSDVQAGD